MASPLRMKLRMCSRFPSFSTAASPSLSRRRQRNGSTNKNNNNNTHPIRTNEPSRGIVQFSIWRQQQPRARPCVNNFWTYTIHNYNHRDRRRWASSSSINNIHADTDTDSQDGADTGLSSDGSSSDTEPTATTTTAQPSIPKKKKSKRKQKRKQSQQNTTTTTSDLDVKFLHFREDDDESKALQRLRDDFDGLAFDHDLSKFKWISLLEKSLVLKARQEHEKGKSLERSSSNGLRAYWKIALKAVSNKKKVPDELKEHFLDRMIVQSPSSSSSIKPTPPLVVETDRDHEDALLLERGQELAVDHPLLWRRYSAKERKQKVRISKQLLKERATANANAFENNSTSLDIYLSAIRIPALRKIHYDQKTPAQRREEARATQKLLNERLPASSYRKMMALVQTYVDCFTSEDGDDDNGITDEIVVTLEPSPFTQTASSSLLETATKNDDYDDNENDTTDRDDKTTTKKKEQQKQFRVLLSNLRKALPQGRIHWIGKDVANFFYVTTPDDVDLTVGNRNLSSDESVTPSHHAFEKDLVTEDPVLGHSQKTWEDVREHYVQSFWNIKKIFLQLEEEEELLQQQQRLSSVVEDIDTLMDPNDDPSSEKSVVRTFDIVTALSRMDTKKATTQRVRPRTYIPLEAMAMGDYWAHFSSSKKDTATDVVLKDLVESQTKPHPATGREENSVDEQPPSIATPIQVFDSRSFPLHPPAERLVLVDNLPIDMTEECLQEAYGRCGDIEAIQIFHSRPDLDPGRKATDATKKIRSPSSSSQRQKWSRPRTPLYAMILYRDPASAKKAACDPLRIFGMVLDHHLMRSHRASDMTMLYLEDVPSSTHNVSSMEFELSQLLRPADLYLCLDDSGHNHVRKKGGKSNQSLSYAIKFPTFEAAYWSYWKLSLKLEFLRGEGMNGPALHWMETPRDADLYWTRKLNF